MDKKWDSQNPETCYTIFRILLYLEQKLNFSLGSESGYDQLPGNETCHFRHYEKRSYGFRGSLKIRTVNIFVKLTQKLQVKNQTNYKLWDFTRGDIYCVKMKTGAKTEYEYEKKRDIISILIQFNDPNEGKAPWVLLLLFASNLRSLVSLNTGFRDSISTTNTHFLLRGNDLFDAWTYDGHFKSRTRLRVYRGTTSMYLGYM